MPAKLFSAIFRRNKHLGFKKIHNFEELYSSGAGITSFFTLRLSLREKPEIDFKKLFLKRINSLKSNTKCYITKSRKIFMNNFILTSFPIFVITGKKFKYRLGIF